MLKEPVDAVHHFRFEVQMKKHLIKALVKLLEVSIPVAQKILSDKVIDKLNELKKKEEQVNEKTKDVDVE